MDINKITYSIKQVRYQKVVINSDNGYDMPEDGLELVNAIDAIKAAPLAHSREGEWATEEVEVLDLDIVEE